MKIAVGGGVGVGGIRVAVGCPAICVNSATAVSPAAIVNLALAVMAADV